MIKVSVVSTNDIWKYVIKCGFIVLILFVILKVYTFAREKFENVNINSNQCISYITDEITVMGEMGNSNLDKVEPEDMLKSELRMAKAVTSRNDSSIAFSDDSGKAGDGVFENEVGNETENIEETANDEVEDVSTDVVTEEVVSKYKNTYNFEAGGIKIKNETSYDLSSLNLSTDITVNNENILIFHTHTCESYTQTDANKYEATGNYRTTDLEHSVSRVGDELQKYLTSYGYNVIHDKTFHDYPAYTGSYGRSLKTVSGILAQNKNTDVVIDLHRDAIGDDSYAPKVKIGDEYAAQIMFVIGTNGSGLSHDNWQQNLEFAMKVQKKANEMYPGLFKPILLRNARYNQHLAKAASIIEIGATGNTLEECEVSAKYLAKVLDEVMK